MLVFDNTGFYPISLGRRRYLITNNGDNISQKVTMSNLSSTRMNYIRSFSATPSRDEGWALYVSNAALETE